MTKQEEITYINTTLDTVSHKRSSMGRVTHPVDGFRYWVGAHRLYNGTPYDGLFTVWVEKKTCVGFRGVRKFVADALTVRGLKDVPAKQNA